LEPPFPELAFGCLVEADPPFPEPFFPEPPFPAWIHDGTCVVVVEGLKLGINESVELGSLLGSDDGTNDGDELGSRDGTPVGCFDGIADGKLDSCGDGALGNVTGDSISKLSVQFSLQFVALLYDTVIL
jgi:hypothetical protein